MRPETEHQLGLVRARSVDRELDTARAEFTGLIDRFLEKAPNSDSDYVPAIDAVAFSFRSSSVRFSFGTDFGPPPIHALSITTPIILDNPSFDGSGDGQAKAYERLDIEVRYNGTLNIRVRAGISDKLKGLDQEVALEEYTAGGLLPPIRTEGKGKVETIKNVVKLFKDVVPQNPRYEQSRRSLRQ